MISQHDLHYLFGFGFFDFEKQPNGIVLTKRRCYIKVMEQFRNICSSKLEADAGLVRLTIDDPEVIKFITINGGFTPKRYLPTLDEAYQWSFIAGYFDSQGEMTVGGQGLMTIKVVGPCQEVIEFIAKKWDIKPDHGKYKILKVTGYKAIDICGKMYENTLIYYMPKYNAYFGQLNFQSELSAENKFQYCKLSENAIAPSKSRVTDSGYDLHILEMSKLYTTSWGASVYKAKTGLAVKPVMGYAFDVAGRSGLPDKGWQFLQGVGICDKSYTGELQATLIKLADGPLPKMPWRALQLVPRHAPIHAQWEEIKNLGESDRAHGGFGSSGD